MTGAGTVQAGLRALTDILRAADVPGPEREARLLMAHAMGIDPSRVTLHARDPLPGATLHAALGFAARRRGGEPLSHIRGYRDFWGRRFRVDSRVLDPRPETECLIALALESPFSHMLDLGTGSGCILLTLLAETPSATGVGVDASAQALSVARINAEAMGLTARATLMESDWISAVAGRFDLIVSNPPYIAAGEMAALQPELRLYEPRMALTDEGDGLSAYRAIAAGIGAHLAPGGRALVEIGAGQGPAVAGLFRAAGLDAVTIHPDLDGRDRVVSMRAPT